MKTTVRYKDRLIDLKPYFEGFPYFGFRFSDVMNTLFYFHRGERVSLLRTDLKAHPDLDRGERVSALDFSRFSAGDFGYCPWKNAIYFIGDECNDEQFNIYRLDLKRGTRMKMTDESYIYGMSIIEENDEIVFIARRREGDHFVSTLKIMDIKTHAIRDIVEDTPEWTFIWGSILHDKKNGGYFFRVTANSDRNRCNLMHLNPETGEKRILLKADVQRTTTALLYHWLDEETFCYLSDESGYINVYRYHVPENRIEAVTRWDNGPVGSAVLFPVNGKMWLFVTRDFPEADTLHVVDPYSGDVVFTKTCRGKYNIGSYGQKRLFAVQTSLDIPYQALELISSWNGDHHFQVEEELLLEYPTEVTSQIVHGKAEQIRFPTFDIDPATGEHRMLHAFVLVPEHLPERVRDRRAVITAFYGGDNIFNKEYQILLQAGFIVMSPAVRGSWGFGADFYALNDKDLGGNEIIDLIYAGRYLARRFQLEEKQIGLMGGSHGGYCAMRGLTFPEEVNGRREHFQWGFAVSCFGISNIIDYYYTCNIPDWVLQKAGDPVKDADKLKDRSPIYHAHRATGPLLLIHGRNDNRVPVDQSRQMADAMKRAGKPYTYLEIPGQGHGWTGLAENLRYFNALFDFLNRL